MNPNPFKTGDVVRLSTGGPAMTVIETGNPISVAVSVAWFERTLLHRDCLPAYLLELVTPDESTTLGEL